MGGGMLQTSASESNLTNLQPVTDRWSQPWYQTPDHETGCRRTTSGTLKRQQRRRMSVGRRLTRFGVTPAQSQTLALCFSFASGPNRIPSEPSCRVRPRGIKRVVLGTWYFAHLNCLFSLFILTVYFEYLFLTVFFLSLFFLFSFVFFFLLTVSSTHHSAPLLTPCFIFDVETHVICKTMQPQKIGSCDLSYSGPLMYVGCPFGTTLCLKPPTATTLCL